MSSIGIPEFPKSPAERPGWQTTEFWLSLVAIIVAYLISSGIAPVGSVWAQALATVATILAAIGYQASRARVKSAQIQAAAARTVAVLNRTDIPTPIYTNPVSPL
jgi:hypothetical protein